MKAVSGLSSCALALLTVTACVTEGVSTDEPVSTGGPATVRRLTQDEYTTVIADTFGSDIKVSGRFDPDVREEGLLAIGTSRVSVTPSSIEQYDGLARSIAAQVVDQQHRDELMGCAPASATAPDDACATGFLTAAGRQLFRRPLQDSEVNTYVALARVGATQLGDFYAGIATSLEIMLKSPDFLFRREIAVAEKDGTLQLDAYSKAQRLSFFLWDTSPDDELLRAAAAGELETEKGLRAQVDRMLGSARLEAGVRAFFTDFLHLDELSGLSKETTIYPKFTASVPIQAQEQTLRTMVDQLVTRRGDYRELFTTRRTFLTPLLGAIYQVPLKAGDGWQAYEFPEGDARAGLVSQISFLAANSHPGRSSPTLRGKAVREVLLCQKVPTPPPNVDFKLVQDTKNVNYPTVRSRLSAHADNPACVGCHRITDPIGLTLERFDSAGQFRNTENGAQIDVSGEMDGVKFEGSTGLGQRLHDTPAAVSCMVNRLASFALGRPPSAGEKEWVAYLQERFAADGYRVPDLMRRIATSKAFYQVSEPEAAAPEAASNGAASSTGVKS